MTQERGYGKEGQTRFLPKEAPGRYGTGRPGFTLLELLIAMVVGLVVLGAVYAVFTVQNTQLSNQESMTEMQQNARIAMEMMTREIGLAGYRDVSLTLTDANCSGSGGALPRCTGTTPWGSGYCLGIMTAAADAIKFTMDITNSAGANNTPDGTVCNANEFITYELYTSSGVQCLGRKSSVTATRQQVVENVEALEFLYYNSAGTQLTQPVALDAIANVKITIRVKAAKADPSYTHPTYGDGYRRYELTSLAVPRNLIGLYGGATSTAGTTSPTGTSSSTPSSTTTTAASSSTTTVASTVLTTSTTEATTTTVATTSSTTTTAGAAPISNVTRTPSGATVAKNTSVTVCATIVGSYATRKVKTNQGDDLTMTLSSGSIYCGTIPKHNNQTVNYWIELTVGVGHVSTGDIYSYDQAG
jgi:type IV pilus assembly protein PilW